ncbi:putative PMS1 protein like protein [Amylocarpus encephaloides]|uniref:PMS1 protein like protein n=1 Tax=Amylocarpus encephaloides TaxID=45428 RepID=A0A9P7YRI7_9HELO|nr:putative PMS1 protein like protein [Amylocarpus encephaloides]
MAITALPHDTIHLLGSAQTLTTATSLVKELIDNSLDARATSIEVLISQNTLDKIQVRDNGHGIQQEDLDALGRRGHTSKLTNFEELRLIGGLSLGFRGEALASAVQLGQVSITTRTDGEAVATVAVLKSPGGVASQSRTSHPIGTTVCVLNFLSKIPVRKQTALKTAPKTLTKTKELLQAYALARPSVRFGLKITKENKGSWSFSPRSNGGIKEAVSQVIGKDASAQCMMKSFVFPDCQTNQDQNPEECTSLRRDPATQYQVDLFLPRPDAEPGKIGHRQYLSIDSRPVSSDKGTMRKIVTSFKSHIKGRLRDSSEIKNPFLQLNIKCPTASYDPNVEPAKDDVIFADEALLVDSFDACFGDVYGERVVAPPSRVKQKQLMDNFDLLLAWKPTELDSTTHSIDPPNENTLPIEPENPRLKSALQTSNRSDSTHSQVTPTGFAPGHDSSKGRRSWGVDVSKEFGDASESRYSSSGQNSHDTRPFQTIPTSEGESVGPLDPLNPWTIAKMTALVQQDKQNESLEVINLYGPGTESSSSRNRSDQHVESLFVDNFNPQPPQQFLNRTPQRRYSNDVTRLALSEVKETGHRSFPRTRRHSINDINFYPEQGSKALLPHQPGNFDKNGVSQARGEPTLSTNHIDTMVELLPGNTTPYTRRTNDFISARNMTETLPLTPPTTLPRTGLKRPTGLRMPFKAPRRVADDAALGDGLVQSRISLHDGLLHSHQQGDNRSGLEWSMEYEQNKEIATQKRREQLRIARKEARDAESHVENKSSPHKNRYNAAIIALEADGISSAVEPQQLDPFNTSLPHSDPRYHLMREQRLSTSRVASAKLTRAKSMKLPLERIPTGKGTHDLLLSLPANLDSATRLARVLQKTDAYVMHGTNRFGQELEPSDKLMLRSKTQNIVDEWLDTDEERRYEVEYTFDNL